MSATAARQLELFAEDKPGAGVALRCPGCGRQVMLYVPGAAACGRCGRRMVPAAGPGEGRR